MYGNVSCSLWRSRSLLYRTLFFASKRSICRIFEKKFAITRFTYFCTFGIQQKNHEKRFGQASSGHDTHCPGKEAIQPHQLCMRDPRKGSVHVHAALPAEVGTTLNQKMKCFCTAPISKCQRKTRQTFCYFSDFFERSLVLSKACHFQLIFSELANFETIKIEKL